MDWALIESWKEMDVPLHVVLRGIEKAFDSWESKPRTRTIKSLLYCQEEVEAQYEEWLEARVGAAEHDDGAGSEQTDSAESEKTPFSATAVNEHLQRCQSELVRLSQARKDDDLTEALARAAGLLQEIRDDVSANAVLDTRRLEDSLTGLERMLNDAMIAVAASDTLDEFKKGVKEQLRPYKTQMDAVAYKQTFDNLLLKRLREQFAVPRLSLFYV